MMKQRIREIDIVRAIGMIMVVLFHVGVLFFGERFMYPDSIVSLLENWSTLGFNLFYLISVVGDQAVPLFIFISGYLLVKRNEQGGFNWLKQRYWKLLGPYWLAVLGSSWMVWMAWQLAPEVLEVQTIAGEFSWIKMIWSGLLLQNFREDWFSSPVPAWWFVPILVQLYLLYPLLFRLLDDWGVNKFVKRILAWQLFWNVMVVYFAVDGSLVYGLWFSGLSWISVLGLGMAIGRVKSLDLRIKKNKRMSVGIGTICWVVGWGLFLWSGRILQVAWVLEGVGWFVSLYAISSWLMVYSSRLGNVVAEIGRRWSYQVYLWHQPVLYLGASALYMWFGKWW